jgi:proline iminopeptidase
MKYRLLGIFILIAAVLKAQKTDSIPYSQGYLYYHTYGQKGEPIIILSGGPGSNCMQEEAVAIRLSAKFRCYLLEQRGTGLSKPRVMDSTTITVKNAEDDITRLINHLKYKEVILYGHSWGGMLGLSYAVHHPNRIKKLLLLGTGEIKSDPKVLRTISDLMNSRIDSVTDKTITLIDEKMTNKTVTPEEKALFKKITLSLYINDKTKLDSIYNILSSLTVSDPRMSNLMWDDFRRTKFDVTVPLKSFNKPMYILCGREDFFSFLSYELKIAKPSAHLHWIEGSGHFPMFETPNAFYSLLFEILEPARKKQLKVKG